MRWKNALRTFRQPPRLSRRDGLLLLLPALAWLGVFHLREHVIEPRCLQNPAICQPEAVFFADRPAISFASGKADRLSFVTQNSSGILAFGATLGWSVFLYLSGSIALSALGLAVLTDWVILAQASLWNGLTTEVLRLLVQRPRPFVYADPVRQGADVSHYTSFVSGHTSFSAAAGVTLLLLLLGRGAPRKLLIPMTSLVATLIFLTGLLRVLAGRHFLTDVLGGALSGTLVAWALSWAHRRHSL
jgi:membrane-associated phospholipid phosphatase